MLSIGFLGFGEAGYVISKALRTSGLESAVAYDCNHVHPTMGVLIRSRAADAGVRLVSSNADLAASADLILSVVTAASALKAAEDTAPWLRSGQVFCDCNSVAPSTKLAIANVIDNAGAAAFVEAAIMAPVQADLSRLPILMTGAQAPAVATDLSTLGMNIEVMQARTGSAAAVKMCRSIVIKGLEALLLECLVTAAHFGCDKAVLRSLEASNPEFNWRQLSEYMIERVFQHGTRRSAEMREVIAMQREAGLMSFMSSATSEVQDWRNRLPEDQIESPTALVSALAQTRSSRPEELKSY